MIQAQGTQELMQKNSGGLLLELVLLVAVLALLSSLAAANYQQTQAYLGGRQAANSIISLLTMTRQQALARGRVFTVCNLSAERCQNTPSNSLSVFVDDGQSGELDGADSVIAHYELPNKFFTIVPVRRYSSFRANGSVNQPTSYYLCHSRQWSWGQRLVISKPGRVRLSDPELDSDWDSRLQRYC